MFRLIIKDGDLNSVREFCQIHKVKHRILNDEHHLFYLFCFESDEDRERIRMFLE